MQDNKKGVSKRGTPFSLMAVDSPRHPLIVEAFQIRLYHYRHQCQAERLPEDMMPLMMLEGRMWNMVEVEGKNETTVNDNSDESRDVPHDAHDLWTHE